MRRIRKPHLSAVRVDYRPGGAAAALLPDWIAVAGRYKSAVKLG